MIADDRGAGPPGFNELVALDRGFKAVRLEEKLQSVLKYIPFFSKYKSPDIVTAVDNIEVHHGVRLLLDSKEPMELGAALFAADRIAFRSKTFAVNHMEKLRAIMEDREIDSMAKNNVIKVYRHMYHTPQLVAKRILTFALESHCDEVRLKAFAVIVQLGIGPRAVVPLVNQLNSLGTIDVLRDVIGRGDRVSFAAASVLCMIYGTSKQIQESVDSMDVDDPDALLMHRLIEVSCTFRYLIGTTMRVSLLTPTIDFLAPVFDNAAADKQGLNVALNIALKHPNQNGEIPYIRTEYLLLVVIKYAALVSPLLIKRTILIALRSSHSGLTVNTSPREHVTTLLSALRSRKVPAWHLYEIGVEALCSGFPDIAQTLFDDIEKQVRWISSVE
ncbi:hypothetical protein HDU87_008299 [Geranomyces variabilis]|uniref:Integrator complex subunit 7 N-terminal domain-containing protein n=1 Tax=Geranomyces variabilis TaxID=109894 RepID=A0AAD5TDN5_9FUNG|nr:hypothetical protein HDU87_008299 [Geranomyces variabilis]